jgi:SAM-dependent methyltransferase
MARSRPSHLDQRAAVLAADHGLVGHQRMVARLERLCGAYVVQAFSQMGFALRPAETVSTASLCAAAGIVERHHRLARRLLEILADDGILQVEGEAWRVAGECEPMHTEAAWAELLAQYPAARPELSLVGRCARSLARVLRGQLDPLSLLFPSGSMAPLEEFYRTNAPALIVHALIAETVGSEIERRAPGRPVRILEVGGGTGATTAAVLGAVPSDGVQYTFTDVSGYFLSRAKARFAGRRFVSFRTLDLDQDPSGQGLGDESFSVVIAANVLHATSDLRRSLRHLRSRLAPGGLLIVLEGVVRQRRYDLSFGLSKGWWHFDDFDLRPSYPLLPAGRWVALLEEQGLVDVRAVPDEADARGGLGGQVVFLASAP